MGLFDFFKKKGNISPKTQMMINRIKERSEYVPTERERMLFLDMVKGKRVEHIFYGNTSLIQENKRDSLKKWLYDSIKENIISITSGNESIAQSLSKKELVSICEKNGLAVSGNKIDLVNRIANLDPMKFESFEISDWFLLTDKGKEQLIQFKEQELSNKSNARNIAYNLLLLEKIEEAVRVYVNFEESYPFKHSGFFMSYSKKELIEILNEIKRTDIFDKIGFPKQYVNKFKVIMSEYYLFKDVILENRFEDIMPGSIELIKRCSLIKNKDYPFIDLKNLIRGYKIYKHNS